MFWRTRWQSLNADIHMKTKFHTLIMEMSLFCILFWFFFSFSREQTPKYSLRHFLFCFLYFFLLITIMIHWCRHSLWQYNNTDSCLYIFCGRIFVHLMMWKRCQVYIWLRRVQKIKKKKEQFLKRFFNKDTSFYMYYW